MVSIAAYSNDAFIFFHIIRYYINYNTMKKKFTFAFMKQRQTYDQLSRNKAQFQSQTGLSLEIFDKLFPYFESAWDEYNNHFTTMNKERIRPLVNTKTRYSRIPKACWFSYCFILRPIVCRKRKQPCSE
jgi:hypothetical protein